MQTTSEKHVGWAKRSVPNIFPDYCWARCALPNLRTLPNLRIDFRLRELTLRCGSQGTVEGLLKEARQHADRIRKKKNRD